MTVLRRAAGVEELQVAHELYLYAPAKQQVAVLDNLAAAVWASSATAKHVDEFLVETAGHYSVPAERVEESIVTLLRTLVDGGFLTVAPEDDWTARR